MASSDKAYGPNPGSQTGLSANAQNTQAAQNQGVLPATLAVTSSTETKVLNPLATTLALAIPIPPGVLEQKQFEVIVTGYITTKNSTNITLGVYGDASTTVTSADVLHKTATPIAQNTASAPFSIKGTLQFDSVSGKLTGSFKQNINNSLDPEIAVTNVLTGISNTSDPVLYLSLSLISSGATTTYPTTLVVNQFSAG